MPLPTGIELAEFKQHINHEGTEHDALLTRVLGGSATLFQAIIRPRELYPTPAGTDRFVRERCVQMLRIPDARAITAVAVDGTALMATDYVLHQGAPEYSNFTHLELLTVVPQREVKLTGTFGYDPIPDYVKVDGIYTFAARRWNERKAGFADSIRIDPGGQTPIVNYFRQLPVSAQLVVERWRAEPHFG